MCRAGLGWFGFALPLAAAPHPLAK